MNLSYQNDGVGTTMTDPLGSTVIDLTSNQGRGQEQDFRNNSGTSFLESTRLMFVSTEQVEDLAGPLPTSNTNSSRPSITSVRSGNTVRTDLLSARSTNSSDQSVAWGSVSHSHGNNKYSVIELPSDENEFNLMCRRKIGHSTTMCLRKSCTISHRGNEIANVQRGEIVVLKASDVAFLEPSMSNLNVTQEVLTQWLSAKKRLEDWSTIFAMANAAAYHEILSTDDIEHVTAFAHLARIHKSPRFMRATRFETSMDTYSNILDVNIGSDDSNGFFRAKKRTFSDGGLVEDSNKERKRSSSDEFSQVDENEKSERLKDAVKHVYKLLQYVTAKLDEKEGHITEEVQMLFSRIEMVQTDLGSRSTNRTDRLEVPTLWGSIALLAGTIDEMQRDINTAPSTPEWKSVLLKEVERIELAAVGTVKQITEDLQIQVTNILNGTLDDSALRDKEITFLSNKLHRVKDDFEKNVDSTDNIIYKLAEGAGVLKDELEDVRRLIRSNGSRGSVSSVGNNCSNYTPLPIFHNQMAEIEKKLADLQEKISQLISDANGHAIKSFGLGFKDSRGSDAWMNSNMDDEAFGLMLDVHLVFENLHYMLSDNEEGTIKTMHSISKLQLANMTQALCLTSFEARVPKLLSKSSNLAMPTRSSKGVTHFDNIVDYADWEKLNCGMREKIKDALALFQTAHQNHIDDHWRDESSKGRILTTKALSTTVVWIYKFLNYIDETYQSVVCQPSFSPETAWELTTQLGRRIFIEVAAPRNGISTQIKVGQGSAKKHQLIFWPILQSHDIMKKFSDANFRDHPMISGEYVKFLTANAGRSSNDKLIAGLKEDVATALKLAKEANNLAVKALNALDEQKKKFEDYKKGLKR